MDDSTSLYGEGNRTGCAIDVSISLRQDGSAPRTPAMNRRLDNEDTNSNGSFHRRSTKRLTTNENPAADDTRLVLKPASRTSEERRVRFD